MHRISYKVLLIFTILATIGGIITLLPKESASYPNIVGYSSVCTFAPAATFYCFFLAGLSCFIRSTFIKDQSGSTGRRIRKHLKFSVIPVILLAAAVVFTASYISIKQEYTDAGSSASVSE